MSLSRYHFRMHLWPSNDWPNDRVRDLLLRGARRGYLTHEELNEQVPDVVIKSEGLDRLFRAIDELGIHLIDAADARS